MYAKALFAKQTAKHSYENRIGFFRPAAFKQRADEHELLAGFQYALGEGEITFDVQPQVDIRTGLVVGGEALARWRRPGGTSVSPAQFVPILERNGFIPMLDKFIWHSVIKWQSELAARGELRLPFDDAVPDELVEHRDEPVALEDGDELRGAHARSAGAAPARERLTADDEACADVHLRLDIEGDLALAERVLEAGQKLVLVRPLLEGGGPEEPDAVLVAVLGGLLGEERLRVHVDGDLPPWSRG